MNRHTGSLLTNAEHMSQSVADILTTRIGTRLERREYGSLLPDLIDQPANGANRLRVYAATAIALMRWEPRLRITRVQLGATSFDGQTTLDIETSRVDTGEPLNLQVPLALGGLA